MKMELNEALKTLNDAGAVVTEAMSPELKKVRAANRELARVESIPELIAVLQKLNSAVPGARFMMDDHTLVLVESEDGEPLIYVKKIEKGDWRWGGVTA